MTDLFIVEAPGKIQKIQAILGDQFKVIASSGHIRDLPVRELGVDLDTFKAKYVTCKGKERTIKQIKALSKTARRVYIATDLDREGEAIAWHINHVANRSDCLRVRYQEISKAAIDKAIQQAGQIDINLFKAQEGRRILDRLVGYPVTSAIRQKHGSGSKLTAGRVQSVGVYLIIERENAISSFKPTNHFGAQLELANALHIEWDTKHYLKSNQIDSDYILDRDIAIAASQTPQVSVIDINKETKQVKPPSPLITSTLQQTAFAQFGYPAEDTMRAAQKLYEQGFITYHRTDSVYLSDDAINAIRDFAAKHNLPLPDRPWSRSSASDAQEAHEAIRPSDPSVGKLSSDASKIEQEIYSLVRQYAISSQLGAAKDNHEAIRFSSECQSFEYKANAKVEIEKGWRQFVQEVDEDADVENDDSLCMDSKLPPVTNGQQLKVIKSSVSDKITKAPKRYRENTLIKKLEKLKVGRPSTFASISATLRKRPYVAEKNKDWYPTLEAFDLHNMLNQEFSFYTPSYTRSCEESLDLIAKGKATQLDFLSKHQAMLKLEIETLNAKSITFATTRSSPATPQRACPKCSTDMHYIPARKNKYKAFFACPDKDSCGHTESEVIVERIVKGSCSKCAKGEMVLRKGKSAFYGCSNFPKCKHTENVDN
jgi:DNA topoisomerase I